MGGIIEDKIFEALCGERLTVRAVQLGIENLRPAYSRAYATLDKHLRKMTRLKQLEREKVNEVYVYWNPAMEGRK